MGVLIARLGDNEFVRWSNTTDSPVSEVMCREDLIECLCAEDQLSLAEAGQLLDFAEAAGTSDPDINLAELLAANCAGPNETWLSLDEIRKHYRASH